MSDFPFEVVYKHFAEPLVLTGLASEKMFSPMIYLVEAGDGEIVNSKPIPQFMVNELFSSDDSKEKLARLLRLAMGAVEDAPFCVVLISEAYMKSVPMEMKAEIGKNSLEDDPDASECVLISICRPEGTRIGILPIKADRSLIWGPLFNDGTCQGRLAPSPKDDMPADAKVH